MRERDIRGASDANGIKTTVRDRDARPAPDLVDRNFSADGPDQLWVADITYIPTWAGFLYLAIVLDVFSRRVVGWAMANHLRTELVLDALEHGDLPAPAEQSDSSLRPGLSVHVDRVRKALPRSRRSAIDGIGRRLLRQCDVRELQRNARMRAAGVSSSSRITARLRSRSSTSLRAGTIRIAGIRRSAISHPTTTSGA